VVHRRARAWTLTVEAVNGVGTSGWRSIMLPEGHALRYSLAALWNHFVAVPVVLFLLYRWLWRILIWTLFLFDVAKLELQLVPTHADKAGGLGFLGVPHESFAGLAFAMGAVIGASVAFRIHYEGADVGSFGFPLTVLIAITQLLFLGPLLVFCPAMVRSRRTALTSYGMLVDSYNRAFDTHQSDRRDVAQARALIGRAVKTIAKRNETRTRTASGRAGR
jgi:hypothetical protein